MNYVMNYAWELPFSPSAQLFQNIVVKKYFTDHQAAHTIQLFVAIKRNFSGIFFFRISHKEEEFSRDYLVYVVTCLFAEQ